MELQKLLRLLQHYLLFQYHLLLINNLIKLTQLDQKELNHMKSFLFLIIQIILIILLENYSFLVQILNCILVFNSRKYLNNHFVY